jgi:hypothetical protein
LLTGAVAAQQPAPGPVGPTITVTGEEPQAEPKLVCKYSSTGTMLRKRICKSKADWAKAEQDSEQALKEMRDWQRVRCGFGTGC